MCDTFAQELRHLLFQFHGSRSRWERTPLFCIALVVFAFSVYQQHQYLSLHLGDEILLVKTGSLSRRTEVAIPIHVLPMKTEGEGWKIWDRISVLGGEPPASAPRVCEWATFRYQTRDTTNGRGTIPMCVHPPPDVLSDTIRETGNGNMGRVREACRYVELRSQT